MTCCSKFSSTAYDFFNALTCGALKCVARPCSRLIRRCMTKNVQFERNKYTLAVQNELLRLETEKEKISSRLENIDKKIERLTSLAGEDPEDLKTNPEVRRLLSAARSTSDVSFPFMNQPNVRNRGQSTLPPFYQQQQQRYRREEEDVDATSETEEVDDQESASLAEALKEKINAVKFIGTSKMKDSQWNNPKVRAIKVAGAIDELKAERNFDDHDLQQAILALPQDLQQEVVAAFQTLHQMRQATQS